MILGPDGTPISTPSVTEAAAQLRGAHASLASHAGPGLEPGWTSGTPGLPDQQSGRYGASRDAMRRLCRTLFFTNPAFHAALKITAAFLTGDDVSYGTLPDRALTDALDDFWQTNSLGQLLTERLVLEWLIDGELAVVFPTGDSDPGRDLPARIALLDVDLAGLRVRADTTRGAVAGDMVYQLDLQRGTTNQSWQEGQFTWAAHDALYNDPRGWPVAMHAADAAIAYIAMLNMRLNVHHVQQRLIAVYKAFLDPNGVDARGEKDGGLSAWRRKTSAFRRLPDQGAVLPLVLKPGWKDASGNTYDGVSESLDFLKPAQGASDAASDMSAILRLVGLALGGLPEHWLGQGGGVTRTTASEMSTPAVRLAKLRQGALRGMLDRVLRTEVKRRHGRDRRYTTVVARVLPGGRDRSVTRRKLPVDLIEFPWNLPTIREESLEVVIQRAQFAAQQNLASRQTLTADLGFDPALERERLGQEAEERDATPPAPPIPEPEPEPSAPPAPRVT